MRILSMTATFGKLEQQTLTLQPGLNIIEAPNEWGKSTWSAFILAMLYGIDTRERSKLNTLADKERYAPWSGSPMTGRMDIRWKGRNITLERGPKGRVPFGHFRAYETESGLEVMDLTADNCGQQLLGVEKSVFLRSGFVRLTDLPVTDDEALRRRLNALVTTGDESDTADRLSQKLKQLKNQCKTNRTTGLIPKCQLQKQQLAEKLTQLDQLQQQAGNLHLRQTQLEDYHRQLTVHQQNLQYVASLSGNRKAEAAQAALEASSQNLHHWQQVCSQLPERSAAQEQLRKLGQLQQESLSLQMESGMFGPEPEPPAAPAPFAGLSPDQAKEQVIRHTKQYTQFRNPVLPLVIMIPAILALIGAVMAYISQVMPYPYILGGIFLLGVVLTALKFIQQRRSAKRLEVLYGSPDPAQWAGLAAEFSRRYAAYQDSLSGHREESEAFRQRQRQLNHAITELTGGEDIVLCQSRWQHILDSHLALEDARREYRIAQSHADTMQTLARTVSAPTEPDVLTFTEAETARQLSDCAQQQRQTQKMLGHCLGQMELLGSRESLLQQLNQVTERLSQLEDTYAALELALQTLQDTQRQLQQRFAPRIASLARSIFSQLTGNRYQRLRLGEDLSLQTGQEAEAILHPALWYSEGTADQLYLALRLAVAMELTPHAPLILDDALVRFDDGRLAAAMTVLRQLAQDKQVILFTCQHREAQLAAQLQEETL